MSKYLTLSLVLCLLPLWVAAKAPIEHPYYQEKLQRFKQMKKTDLIFLGDSLTDYHDWSSFGPHHNAGIAGDTTDGLLYRLHYTLGKKPKSIIVMIGINDLLQGVSLSQVKEDYSGLLDALEKIDRLIILSNLPVSMMPQTEQINEDVIALNYFLKQTAKKRDARYIDLYKVFTDVKGGLIDAYTLDGVHLNEKGYEVWEQTLHTELDDNRSQ